MSAGERLGGYTLAPGAEWTGRAATWPVVLVARHTEPGHHMTSPELNERAAAGQDGPRRQLHLCCARCDSRPSVFCLAPDARDPEGYRVTTADLLSGILAHIRRSHAA